MALHLPFEPPIEPMLAKAVDGLPDGDGWLFEPKWDGFRAIVFRDGDEVYTQSRDLKPLDRYFPELADPLRAALPGALRPRRRGRHRARRRARLRGAAAAHPSGGVAGEDAGRASRRPASSPGTSSRSATRTCATSPQGERRDAPGGGPGRRGAARPSDARPPATARLAADWFDRFEGAGLDGVVAKRLDAPYQPGKRAMLKIKHQRTADCVVAGFRWHKNGPGTHIGSLLLGLFDDEGTLHHVGVTSSFTWDRRAALVEELAPLREDALDDHPWRDWAEWATTGDADASGQRLPGRDVALEPRQGPLVGAAAGRARRRGRLRPPPGRPLPPRDDVQALAPGQAARRAAATTSSRPRRRTRSRRIFGA